MKELSNGVLLARQVALVADALRRRGHSLVKVTGRSGLDSSFLEVLARDLDTPVPFPRATAFLHAAEIESRVPMLCLHAGREAPLGAWSVAELPLTLAPDHATREELLATGFGQPGILVHPKTTGSTFTLRVHAAAASPSIWRLLLGTWLRLADHLGLQLHRADVPLSADQIRSWSGPRVTHQAPALRLVFTYDAERGGNGYLYPAVRSLAAPRDVAASLEARLRAEIENQLHAGRVPTVQQMARHAGMSVRTLQRRLREGEQTYRSLLIDVRCTYATRLLRDPQNRINQVAFRAGFSDPSSFVRSFRAWCGMTAQEWRARRRRLDRPGATEPASDDLLAHLASAASSATPEPLRAWITRAEQEEPAMMALGEGWMAAHEGRYRDAQRRWTDAARSSAAQREVGRAAYALLALADLYLSLDLRVPVRRYLAVCEQLAHEGTPDLAREAALLKCLAQVRENHIHEALQALHDLPPPSTDEASARFRAQSVVLLLEAGQPDNAAVRLGELARTVTPTSVNGALLRAGCLLVEADRRRQLRQLLSSVEPLRERLHPTAAEVARFLWAASIDDAAGRLEALQQLRLGELPLVERQLAVRCGLQTARDAGASLEPWLEQLELADAFVTSQRTLLRSAEARARDEVLSATRTLAHPLPVDPRTLEVPPDGALT